MREIKFRAWDGKSMLDVPINHSGYRLNELLEDICDNYKLMQYTGLKDKNGVEIYEGDIVSDYSFNDGDPMVVRFGEYMTDEEHMLCWLGEGSTGIEPLSLATPLEVIGNVYENPELLKD